MPDHGDLMAVMDALPTLMIALEGPELRLAAVSGAALAASQRTEWLGRPFAELYPELVIQGVVDVYAEVMATGEPFHNPEWRLQLVSQVDGSVNELIINWTIVAWHRPGGGRGAVGVAYDVTDQVRARERAERESRETGQRYRHALDVVDELQQALLPASLPLLPRVDLAARYLIAGAEQAAGGDWFDARPLAGNRVGLVVGDVVGHGVAAAAVMSQLRTLLADALESTGDLAAALERVERFASSVPGARSATVVVAVLDPEAGTLDYLTRGHPAPLLIEADGRGRQLLASGGGPLGSGRGGPAQRTTLGVGDVLVLFSDGLVERPDRAYPEGLNALTRLAEAAVVGQLWPAGALFSSVERVCADAVEMLTRGGYDDDVTVLAAAVQAPVEPLDVRVHAGAEEIAELRARVRGWLTELRIDATEALTLELAISEAVDNAVEHGLRHNPDGTVAVFLGLAGDGRVHVRIQDNGAWREPSTAAAPERGRGLTALGSVGDDLDVRGRANGTTVSFHRLVTRAVSTGASSSPVGRSTGDAARQFECWTAGDPPVLHLRGPVDVLAVDRLRRELAQLSRGGTTAATIDLSEVTHLTSVGVAALAETLRAAEQGGHPVALLAPTGSPAAFVLDLVSLPRQPTPTHPDEVTHG
jgi:serine phosphatase RsbU (regulator of sigma subunit)/anti-sigma regulatory factor (Ser/Thr protein kinase)/ABC-type transporter Mla MlaB component